MKAIKISIITFILCLNFLQPSVKAKTIQIDPLASKISLSVNQEQKTVLRASFTLKKGEYKTSSRFKELTLQIHSSSINSNNPFKDTFYKSNAVLASSEYPIIEILASGQNNTLKGFVKIKGEFYPLNIQLTQSKNMSLIIAKSHLESPDPRLKSFQALLNFHLSFL